jgi:2-hydroxy-6-oxonona-2,4-dienedioate hydrolase
MVSRRLMIGLGMGTGALLAGGAATALSFDTAIARAHAAISPSLSTIISTRHGDMEYADIGTGPAVLMIHGTGGGFDQGLLFARPLVAAGYRVIAPSRFGYLRSSFPDEPSSANQADALVDLLDQLDIDRIAISGGSAGALSAIEFAIRHPDRTAALLPIVPATYVPGRQLSQTQPPEIEAAMALLRSDFLFWMALNVVPDLMIGNLLATDPALLKAVSATEAARAREILWSILPVSQRAEGLINDARLAGNPARSGLETIAVPTLAISVEDDRFNTAAAARHIAATVPGARSIIYPTGGHIWLGHDAELFGALDSFLMEIGYR